MAYIDVMVMSDLEFRASPRRCNDLFKAQAVAIAKLCLKTKRLDLPLSFQFCIPASKYALLRIHSDDDSINMQAMDIWGKARLRFFEI